MQYQLFSQSQKRIVLTNTMKNMTRTYLIIVCSCFIVFGGCSGKADVGHDACKNNGGTNGEFRTGRGSLTTLWLCQDGSVRWRVQV